MPIILKILYRVIVSHFYKINAGFFLVCFFVLFGLPNQALSFHLSLINGILQSQLFLLLVFVAWILYNFKCMDYVIKQLQQPQQLFLHTLNCLPTSRMYLYMLMVHVQVYLPVLLYAAAIATLAIKQNLYFVCFQIVMCNTGIIAFSAGIYLRTLQKKENIIGRLALAASPGLSYPKLRFVIPLLHIWYNRKQMLVITKLFTVLLLYGFIRLYQPDHYDLRPIQLCLLLVAASHAAIIFQIHELEEQPLLFLKNLPLTTYHRFTTTLVMNALLLFPEAILLWKGHTLHFKMVDYLQLILLAIAIMSILHTTLYLDRIDMDRFMRIVFWIMSGLFLIILYSPGVWLPAIILMLSFAMYTSYYYQYEK